MASTARKWPVARIISLEQRITQGTRFGSMKPTIHYQIVNPNELTQRTKPFSHDWFSVSSSTGWESEATTGLDCVHGIKYTSALRNGASRANACESIR